MTEAVDEMGWWCAERVEGKRANCGDEGDGPMTVGIEVVGWAMWAGGPIMPMSTESNVVGLVEAVCEATVRGSDPYPECVV